MACDRSTGGRELSQATDIHGDLLELAQQGVAGNTQYTGSLTWYGKRPEQEMLHPSTLLSAGTSAC